MTVKLVLASVTCDNFELASWLPKSLEETHCSLIIRVGFEGGEGTNIFYGRLFTPEALRARGRGWMLAGRSTIVVSHFDYQALVDRLRTIVDGASRETWEEGCIALSRHFEWEYEDYEPSEEAEDTP